MIGIYWNAQGIAADYNAASLLDRLGAVVVLFAHRLQVIRVIELYLVPFVRLDMIHHARHTTRPIASQYTHNGSRVSWASLSRFHSAVLYR